MNFILVPIDICFIIIILIFALSALSKGLVKELFSKVSFIGALAFAIAFTLRLDIYVSESIKNPALSKTISFVIIFTAVFLVISIIQQLIAKIFSGEIMKGLDRTLGFLLGIIEGLIVVAFVIVVLTAQPWFDALELFDGSLFYKYLGGMIQIPADYLRRFAENV
ncbi:MAG: CvpA family protein [Treponema sp.]